MESLHIREILSQIGKDIKCPSCKSPIPPTSVKIAPHSSQDCLINMECPRCHLHFGGSAKMMSVLTPKGKSMNASSLLHHDPYSQNEVAKNEVFNVSSAMRMEGFSFSDQFKNDKQ